LFLIGQVEYILETLKSENNVVMLPLNENLNEQTMKYKDKTIHKNEKCNTWYTRFRYKGKQYYISAKTQKECLDKLKIALKQNKIEQKNIETTNAEQRVTLKQWYENG